MITLRGKLKKDNDITNSKNNNRRASIRDKLLIKEVFIITRFGISCILMLINMIYLDLYGLFCLGTRNGTDIATNLSSHI